MGDFFYQIMLGHYAFDFHFFFGYKKYMRYAFYVKAKLHLHDINLL